jgi:hypothetical protein
MAGLAAAGGWSLRAVARAAHLSLGSVRNLMRPELGLFADQPLGAVDALCVRALAGLGANRSTNRASQDRRTAELLLRDRRAVELLRDAVRSGDLVDGVRLLVQGDTTASLVRKDYEILSALDAAPEASVVLLPVGCWATSLRLGTSVSASGHRASGHRAPIAESLVATDTAVTG